MGLFESYIVLNPPSSVHRFLRLDDIEDENPGWFWSPADDFTEFALFVTRHGESGLNEVLVGDVDWDAMRELKRQQLAEDFIKAWRPKHRYYGFGSLAAMRRSRYGIGQRMTKAAYLDTYQEYDGSPGGALANHIVATRNRNGRAINQSCHGSSADHVADCHKVWRREMFRKYVEGLPGKASIYLGYSADM